MLIEKISNGIVTRSKINLKPTNKIINERKSLKCSPFIKFENLEPICTPITDPISNMSARTISTVWFCEACKIVVLAATNMIWIKEVPITNEVGIQSK